MIIVTTDLTIAIIIVTALASLALGGFVGASLTMARVADQVAACHELRAESADINAESFETAVATHGSIVEWVCTMRGGLCR